MDCTNHSGVNAAAYCQNCGKPLCQACVRSAPGGQLFCDPCMTAWQSAAQRPFMPPPAGAPNPVLAGFLGLIPGVGAMYNGQFLKGLAHVLIFAVLVSAAHVFGVFGLLIAGWVFYQVFDAYHTAKARRDGEPLPDPLGLNDIGSWLGIGQRGPGWMPPGAPPPPGAGSVNAGQTGADQAGGHQAGTYQAGTYGAPYQSAPYQNPAGQPVEWQTPYQGASAAPFVDPGAAGTGATSGGPGVPPVPPMPPATYWRRPEPIGAVILIALGVLFLLNKIDWFSGRIFEYSWPLVLIGLGIWLIVRRVGNTHGGQK
ncbi:MAG: B-box zinc finger protein [Terracidiphilus sp.]